MRAGSLIFRPSTFRQWGEGMQTADDVRALARRYARLPTVPVVRWPVRAARQRPIAPPLPTPKQVIYALSPIKRIIQACAAHYEMNASDLTGDHRAAHYVRSRHIAMYLAKQGGASFPQIGRRMGGRDHTTAMHGYRKIKAQLEIDEQLQADVAAIKLTLGVE